jgi:3-hydroxymyristoyl/3-hydroxydecanoyl-(acyl carrier protein) dehydratase
MGPGQPQSFGLDHPTAAGHFPGNPIIPGAVLLDAVFATLERHGTCPSMGYRLSSAKFLHPVRPGETLEIHWGSRENGRARFECHVGERVVLQGAIEIHEP